MVSTYSRSHHLGGLVDDRCRVVVAHWAAHVPALATNNQDTSIQLLIPSTHLHNTNPRLGLGQASGLRSEVDIYLCLRSGLCRGICRLACHHRTRVVQLQVLAMDVVVAGL